MSNDTEQGRRRKSVGHRRSIVARPAVARLVAPFVLAALAAGCQTDRPFKTSAVYGTADARCTMGLQTQGVVRAGDDLARDAEGRLTLSSPSQEPGAPPLGAVIGLRGGDLMMDGVLGTGIDTLLAVNLTAVGCALTPAEQAELRRAMEGALTGPKGTLMDGQTKTLRVVSVRFGAP